MAISLHARFIVSEGLTCTIHMRPGHLLTWALVFLICLRDRKKVVGHIMPKRNVRTPMKRFLTYSTYYSNHSALG